ncbi:MAG: UDP-N-acetylmuramoyl-L-alanyl-D-glutamate--2,6-diaminopimelate ligase [Oscillospiraceae bacterium]|nr:UDP-N-acetylmuramoyl-L-alanyl-D-glutamate--2,6-diaminopimelate ligase [Oscillospiraceae bacterium]
MVEMRASELFEGITHIPGELREKTVAGVTSDSREIEKDFVFVCIKGESFDGHSAAERALELGAAAVVTQNKLGIDREINVADTREIYPELLSAFYGRPEKRLKICAVTGTNGKTTIVSLCAQLTRLMGHRTGVIGTLGTDTGSGLKYSHSGPPTTPEPRKLYSLFGEMVKENTEYCFVEASSQALVQHRFAKNSFKVAAFTNLTRDHLDYHKTMENYFAAKLMLFDNCEYAVVNIDDEYGGKTAEYCKKNGVPVKTLSLKGKADFYTEFVKIYPDRAEFIFTDAKAKKSYPVRFALTGEYNVLNALTAIVMCGLLGFYTDEIVTALERINGVSGRLETLYSGEFTVVRDYAHTEDGLEKLLSTLKPLAKNRLVCLFGAAGERDAGKRPDMGKAAAKYADLLIVTTDSPRHEDPQKTIDDVVKGIPDGILFEEYTDRGKAVIRALEIAEKGDIVALCGKGHEDYQAIGDEYLHFDEKEIVDNFFKDSR